MRPPSLERRRNGLGPGWQLAWLTVISAMVVAIRLHLLPALDIAIAYKAKIFCSAVFLSVRPPSAVLAEDLGAGDLAPLRWLRTTIDDRRQRIEVSLFGMAGRSAVFSAGRGCTLISKDQDQGPSSDSPPQPRRAPPRPPAPPEPSPRLREALDWAFAEPEGSRPRRTRAVVILQNGTLLAERYAAGFDAATPLAGWSLAKVATNALIGILVAQGRLRLDDRVLGAEWERPGDPRRQIRIDQMLRMESGLKFSERPGSLLQDVTLMLFRAPDAAAYAAAKPLVATPGSRWSYASGNSNLLCRLIRQTVGEADYPDFPRRELFAPLGMDSAILERDAAGNFVCSSFMYASARDWAKLGQLFTADGVFGGRRILPPGWSNWSAQPAPTAPGHGYAAHFWLATDDQDSSRLPGDSIHALGYEGQSMSLVPSRRLVVVRLGLTRDARWWRPGEFLQRVLAALTP